MTWRETFCTIQSKQGAPQDKRKQWKLEDGMEGEAYDGYGELGDDSLEEG